MQCPKCGADDVKALSGRRVQRYQCKGCGYLFREPDGEVEDARP